MNVLTAILLLLALTCSERSARIAPIGTNSSVRKGSDDSASHHDLSASPWTPKVLAEPVAIAPIIGNIQKHTGNDRFVVQFKIAPNGNVLDCKILSVEGRSELVARIPIDLRECLCAAILRRRYSPPGQVMEGSFVV